MDTYLTYTLYGILFIAICVLVDWCVAKAIQVNARKQKEVE